MSAHDDEQLGEILEGRRPEPDDLDRDTRRRLDDMRAVRGRLRSAFASVSADDAFAARLRSQLRGASAPAGAARGNLRPYLWRVGLPLAAVAAALLILVPTVLLDGPTARAELAAIHLHEADGMETHVGNGPAEQAAWLGERTGITPIIPAGDGIRVLCACVANLGGKATPAYMLEVDGKRISVIVTREAPDAMKLGQMQTHDGRPMWCCGHGGCKITAVKIGDLTYCAVGEVDEETLRKLLRRIRDAANQNAAGRARNHRGAEGSEEGNIEPTNTE